MRIITYSQSSGVYTGYDVVEGKLVNPVLFGTGWAGHGDGKNNPDMQSVRMVGPLPRGRYTMAKPKQESTGPFSIRLTPVAGTEMFGRDGFLIHGPSRGENYGQESHGCPILIRPSREQLWEFGADFFDVIK